MKTMFAFLPMVLLLNACGYKGDLYLPRENDRTAFGVVQTGIDFTKPNKINTQPGE